MHCMYLLYINCTYALCRAERLLCAGHVSVFHFCQADQEAISYRNFQLPTHFRQLSHPLANHILETTYCVLFSELWFQAELRWMKSGAVMSEYFKTHQRGIRPAWDSTDDSFAICRCKICTERFLEGAISRHGADHAVHFSVLALHSPSLHIDALWWRRERIFETRALCYSFMV